MRADRHEKKSRKKWPSILFVFLLLIGGVTGYAYYQYKQGVNQSLKEINNGDTDTKDTNVEYDFEGKKDQYGDTNVLLLGSDARGKETSRADTIMILHYNEDKDTFKLTSIMRDSYVAIPGHN